MIYKAGLAEGVYHEGGLNADEGLCVLTGLTWAGHDFVEAARNQNLWDKAKAKAKETIGGLVTESLKLALTFYANQAMTQGLGR